MEVGIHLRTEGNIFELDGRLSVRNINENSDKG